MDNKDEKVFLEWQKSEPVDPSILTDEFCANARKILDMGIEEMPGYSFDCVCGKHHSVDMKHLLSGSGAVERLPEILDKYPEKKSKTILLFSHRINLWFLKW